MTNIVFVDVKCSKCGSKHAVNLEGIKLWWSD